MRLYTIGGTMALFQIPKLLYDGMAGGGALLLLLSVGGLLLDRRHGRRYLVTLVLTALLFLPLLFASLFGIGESMA